MSTSPAHQAEMIHRRSRVAEYYLQGWPQSAIAEKVGVVQSVVSDDLRRIRQEWRDSAVRDFDAARDLELQKIDRVEREAWAAWERSQKPAQSAIISGDGADKRTRKSLKNQHGDPRFLDLIHRCIAARRALLGLDSPPQPVSSAPVQGDAYALAVAHLSVDELRVLKGLQARGVPLALTETTAAVQSPEA